MTDTQEKTLIKTDEKTLGRPPSEEKILFKYIEASKKRKETKFWDKKR